MSNRQLILNTITRLMRHVKNSATHEERFTHLDNIAQLSNILQDVTLFEKSLIEDLDVD